MLNIDKILNGLRLDYCSFSVVTGRMECEFTSKQISMIRTVLWEEDGGMRRTCATDDNRR